MRYLFLLAGLMLSTKLLAQYGAFKAGSYILTASPTVRRQGEIKLQRTGLVTIKDSNGKKADYTTRELTSFRVGKSSFYVDSNLNYPDWVVKDDRIPAFTEMVDSGKVVLVRVYLLTKFRSGLQFGASPQSYQPDYFPHSFIRRIPGAAAEIWSGEVIQTCLAERPDLYKLLTAKWLSKDRIEDDDIDRIVIHSLNTGQPYVPPLSHYETMKQQALAKRSRKAAADSTHR